MQQLRRLLLLALLTLFDEWLQGSAHGCNTHSASDAVAPTPSAITSNKFYCFVRNSPKPAIDPPVNPDQGFIELELQCPWDSETSPDDAMVRRFGEIVWQAYPLYRDQSSTNALCCLAVRKKLAPEESGGGLSSSSGGSRRRRDDSVSSSSFKKISDKEVLVAAPSMSGTRSLFDTKADENGHMVELQTDGIANPGENVPTDRIYFGSTVASVQDFADVVSVKLGPCRRYAELTQCTGTILTATQVLTAAHCCFVDPVMVALICGVSGRGGIPIKNHPDNGGTTTGGGNSNNSYAGFVTIGHFKGVDEHLQYDVESCYPHPGFLSANAIVNPKDIAVLTLRREMPIGNVDTVRKGYILEAYQSQPNKFVVAAGFGRTHMAYDPRKHKSPINRAKELPEFLREETILLRSKMECMNGEMLCSKHTYRRTSTGDSGGPLYKYRCGTPYVIGVHQSISGHKNFYAKPDCGFILLATDGGAFCEPASQKDSFECV